MAKSALAATADLAAGPDPNRGAPAFLRAKITTARFYGEHILPRAAAYAAEATAGSATLMAMAEEAF